MCLSADERLEFFEKRIRPVLVEHCYECHAADADKVQGGLLLDSRAGWQSGGDSGPAVVPGKPEESLLLSALRHETFEMPPDSQLSPDIIRDFETWIRSGAIDPREGKTVRPENAIDLRQGRTFWSFQPIRTPAVPSVESDWPETPIDHFLAAHHADTGRKPATDAPPDQVLRRLYFALTGLPPHPVDIREFHDAWSQDKRRAVVSVTDRLLMSPRYGERWGRHWLDVARFAESSGGGRSLMLPHAWRFRDYVIQSFSEDKPFDALIREHIAGDLLPSDSDEQFNEQLCGTAYLALGPINYELQDKELLRMEVIDEQIDTIGRTFLGLTLGCARCHDHKFDPVPTREYYALAGIFRSTKSLVPGNVSKYVTTPFRSESHREAMQLWEQQQQELEVELRKLKQRLGSVDPQERAPAVTTSDLDAEEQHRLQAQLEALQKGYDRHVGAKPRTAVTMSVTDEDQPADWHLHIRGGVRHLGPVVRRGFLSVVSTDADDSGTALPVKIPEASSGRRELADWIASPNNPLTARVYVNRIWQHLIGEGLVRTPDNFGLMGMTPTHPQLLDYLASTFIKEDQWSTKRLIRRIVTARIFRLSSDVPTPLDPENRHLTRAFRRQLDAEALRDGLLQISGQLNLTITGGRTISKLTKYDGSYDHSSGSTRIRSVYVPFLRNAVLETLNVFDTANPNVVTGRRNQTVLPGQALYLMNSTFIRDQAQHAAAAFLAAQSEEQHDADVRIHQAFLLALGRAPTPPESKIVSKVLESAEAHQQAWKDVFSMLFCSMDFRFID